MHTHLPSFSVSAVPAFVANTTATCRHLWTKHSTTIVKVTVVGLAIIAATAIALTIPSWYVIGGVAIVALTSFCLIIAYSSCAGTDNPAYLKMLAAAALLNAIVVAGAAAACTIRQVPLLMKAIKACDVSNFVKTAWLVTLAWGYLAPLAYVLANAANELLTDQSRWQAARAFFAADGAEEPQTTYQKICTLACILQPKIIDNNAIRSIMPFKATGCAIALRYPTDPAKQLEAYLQLIDEISATEKNREANLLGYAPRILWPLVFKNFQALEAEKRTEYVERLLTSFSTWHAIAAPLVVSDTYWSNLFKSVHTNLKIHIAVERTQYQEKLAQLQLLVDTSSVTFNTLQADTDALLAAIGSTEGTLSATHSADIKALVQRLGELRRQLFEAEHLLIQAHALDIPIPAGLQAYDHRALLITLEQKPCISTLTHLSSRIQAAQDQHAETLDDDAWDFLVTKTCQLPDKTRWIQLDDFKQWLGATNPEEVDQFLAAEPYGLKTVQDLLTKGILTRAEFDQPEVIKEKVAAYIRTRQGSPSDKVLTKIGLARATLTKIDQVAARLFAYTAFTFCLLAPVLVYPAKGALGFGAGVVYQLCTRLFGSHLEKWALDHSHAPIVDCAYTTFRIARSSLALIASFTTSRRPLFPCYTLHRKVEAFVIADGWERLHILHQELLATVVSMGFGGEFQGFSLGQETCERAYHKIQQVWQ